MMWVSHETIYQSLFVQPRVSCRASCARCLRSGRVRRRTAACAPVAFSRHGDDRRAPAEVTPGQFRAIWRRDLICGSLNRSAWAPSSNARPACDALHPRHMSDGPFKPPWKRPIATMPAALFKTSPGTQKGECRNHRRSRSPPRSRSTLPSHSPWQRGSTRTPTGLLRQFFFSLFFFFFFFFFFFCFFFSCPRAPTLIGLQAPRPDHACAALQ